MNSVQDAIYNWLTIKVVMDHRPEDAAANETVLWFEQTLQEKFGLTEYSYKKSDEWYTVSFKVGGAVKELRFPEDMIEVMLHQILQNPEHYRNYPSE